MKTKTNKKQEFSYFDLVKKTGAKYATIHRVLNGKRRPSPELAEKLEKATGHARYTWIWPETYHNPLVRKAK